MTRDRRFLQRFGRCLCSAILLVTTAAGVLAQESSKTRKFLKKPLVIEDQGSFFIGGVPNRWNTAETCCSTADATWTLFIRG